MNLRRVVSHRPSPSREVHNPSEGRSRPMLDRPRGHPEVSRRGVRDITDPAQYPNDHKGRRSPKPSPDSRALTGLGEARPPSAPTRRGVRPMTRSHATGRSLRVPRILQGRAGAVLDDASIGRIEEWVVSTLGDRAKSSPDVDWRESLGDFTLAKRPEAIRPVVSGTSTAPTAGSWARFRLSARSGDRDRSSLAHRPGSSSRKAMILSEKPGWRPAVGPGRGPGTCGSSSTSSPSRGCRGKAGRPGRSMRPSGPASRPLAGR